MKKFITTIFFFSFIFLIMFVWARLLLKKEKNYNSAFVDKLELLKKSKNEKKIILLGGSAIGWGVSAELIQQNTGIRAINLGHFASFGFLDYQDFLMDNISEDDIIIFSPEWNFYFNPTSSDAATLDDLNNNNLNYSILLKRPKYFFKSIFSKIDLPRFRKQNFSKYRAYSYNCYNNNGDIISHCRLPAIGPKFYNISYDSIKVNSFHNYYKFLNRKNTFMMFPPTQEEVYYKFQNQLELIQNRAFNCGLKYIDSLHTNIYPNTSFYDAEYHLKCSEKEKRTFVVIDFIKNLID
jgi:hypothetical protein